ncbi:MAG: hypothetical protein U0X87_02185 [Anaerolineales bacterium]
MNTWSAASTIVPASYGSTVGTDATGSDSVVPDLRRHILANVQPHLVGGIPCCESHSGVAAACAYRVIAVEPDVENAARISVLVMAFNTRSRYSSPK